MNEDPEPKCPYNHFGRGVNFVVPQEETFLQRYEAEWAEWENKHPDDLSGETAYNEWKARQQTKPSTIREMPIASTPEPEPDLVFTKPGDRGPKQMYRFNLPTHLHDRLKQHCERTGRQMSPVIRRLIEEYLNGH